MMHIASVQQATTAEGAKFPLERDLKNTLVVAGEAEPQCEVLNVMHNRAGEECWQNRYPSELWQTRPDSRFGIDTSCPWAVKEDSVVSILREPRGSEK